MDKNAEKFAWDKFTQTGKIGYYLFYTALMRAEDKYGEKGNGDSNSQNPLS